MANFGSFRGCGPVFNFVRVGRVGAGKGGLLGLVVLWLGCSPWAGGAARAGWLVGLGWFTLHRAQLRIWWVTLFSLYFYYKCAGIFWVLHVVLVVVDFHYASLST